MCWLACNKLMASVRFTLHIYPSLISLGAATGLSLNMHLGSSFPPDRGPWTHPTPLEAPECLNFCSLKPEPINKPSPCCWVGPPLHTGACLVKIMMVTGKQGNMRLALQALEQGPVLLSLGKLC